jgi:hypothetical protein
MKLLLALFLFFISVSSYSNTYLQVNGLSLHDRSGYNGLNYGAGIEHAVTQDWNVAGGWYYNSERRGSTYAYGRYSVYKQDRWDIGAAVGAVTGYQRAAVVPMAFPEVCYAWVCGLYAPRVEHTGANVVGLRLRIPVN